MIDKWRQTLTGGSVLDLQDADIAAYIAKLTLEAEQYWKTLNTLGAPSKRDYLWPDLKGDTDSHLISVAYNRIRSMALAFAVEGSSLERNGTLRDDIISALDWMYENRYRDGMATYSNWWHWEIGAPLALNDAVVLMLEHLTKEQIARYMRAVDHFSLDLQTCQHTAANRIWVCLVQAIRSIMLRDGRRLAIVRDAISPVFAYVSQGDGFYKDGSFIQHGRFAYTGSYGKSLLGDLSKLLTLLGGTEWEVTDPEVKNVYEWVFEAFVPIMVNGSLMDMTRGREISRYYSQEHEAGHGVIDAVLRLSMSAPEAETARMRRLVKMWILSDTSRKYVEHAPLELITPAKKLVNDKDVEIDGDRALFKMYSCMDRAVHHRNGFAFGISMYSERIRNYEVTNGENLKGWYTGHGNTFLYNSDLGQFSDAFWPTVDANRLPGTTVTTVPLEEGYGWHRVSSKSWVGGAALQDRYGAVGMKMEDYKLEEKEEPLTAIKSWFLFDDEVVALGSDIRSESRFSVETIVENRKLNERGDNPFTVDGEVQSNKAGWQREWSAARWMHLKGQSEGAEIGYFFPQCSRLKALRETRMGKWSDISKGENKQPCENAPLVRSYLTLWYDHGVKPDSGAYAYVLLPGASVERTETYADDPQIEIVEQTSEAHAVFHMGMQLLAVNFWKDGPTTVGSVTCRQKAALLFKETTDEIEVAVADPTHRNQSAIEIEINRTASRVLWSDDRVKVEQLSPSIRLSVQVHGSAGKTFQVKLEK